MKTIITLSVCLLIASCSTVRNIGVSETVKPWQKDILSKPSMKMPYDEMFAFSDDHIFFSKEASAGGGGGGGGGCGCN